MASRQGRKERPINPEDGPVEAFAWRLRRLREDCGSPTYKEMERAAGYSSSALSAAANGQAPPSLEVVRAYVRSCLVHAKAGGERVEAATQEWTSRWRTLQSQLRPAPSPSLPRSPDGSEAVTASAPPPAVPMTTDGSPGGEPAAAPAAPGSPVGPPGTRAASAVVPGAAAGAPAPRRGPKPLRTPAGRVLAVISAMVLAGAGAQIAQNIARPGAAGAGSGPAGPAIRGGHHGSGAFSGGRGEGPADDVQVDALGEQSRCGPARPGAVGVLLRACVKVAEKKVLFALKITNPGPDAAEVTAKLRYVRSGQYYACHPGEGTYHGTLPAGGTHVTDAADCAAPRLPAAAAYQADGLLAPGATERWTTHQLSPRANVYPEQVRWRCAGDTPC
ncbi:helix-turn-helix domain-containing protein [Streptomyces sp. SP18CS02]|uniref:helix-turn-helix domain-containing protein n=1 Tax=Streptomyces sp. SP18CS02 TaxID=3002531 RepID=UPI002E7765ED|nr:helix-turn-helix domain-containing protein [Streptomyces sp. SP18CS02]MEE1753145.1 helix-turn-helix domain-containing protein [Streptomyces sp. SP18CS02]